MPSSSSRKLWHSSNNRLPLFDSSSTSMVVDAKTTHARFYPLAWCRCAADDAHATTHPTTPTQTTSLDAEIQYQGWARSIEEEKNISNPSTAVAAAAAVAIGRSGGGGGDLAAPARPLAHPPAVTMHQMRALEQNYSNTQHAEICTRHGGCSRSIPALQLQRLQGLVGQQQVMAARPPFMKPLGGATMMWWSS